MANVADVKQLKELKIKLKDGTEQALIYDLNALAELEEVYGSIESAFEDMEAGKFKAIRCVMWAGLLDALPDLTIREAGKLVDMVQMTEMAKVLSQATERDMPDISKGEEEIPN